MKKNCVLAMLLLCMAVFTSCDKDEVPSDKVRLKIKTSALDVVKNLKDPQGNLYFADKLPEGYRLRINCFVYCYSTIHYENDKLVATETAYLDNVTAAANFTVETDPGSFRVVTTADLVKMSGNQVSMSYNDISPDKSSINVQIQFKNKGGYLNAAGKAVSEKIALEEGGSQKDIVLNMKPIGSLITATFFNVDATKAQEITYRPAGVNYKYWIHENGDAEILSSGAEEKITLTAGKLTYYSQNYAVINSSNTSMQWAGIQYFTTKTFGFVPGVNNFIKIDFMTDVATVYDDFVN